MFQLPPVPAWEGLHPLIVHFPIVLLMVAPLFVLIGALVPRRHSRSFMISALILMLLGTIASYVAIETGEAAGKIATRTPEINRILERHGELAEQTRLSFTVLTVVFAGVLIVPALVKRENRITTTILPLAFLLIYGGGVVLLANTAHNGGRLVHEFGVQSLVAPTSGEPLQTGD
jgi:uncharacterized membrane protein